MPTTNLETIQTCLIWATDQLTSISTSPDLDSEVLLAYVLETSRIHIITNTQKTISPKNVAAFTSLIAKRQQGVPVAYLIGQKDFYGRTFEVTTDTLIPRPDSECIIDFLKQKNKQSPIHTVVDIGTGSGCLAITLKEELPHTTVYASDMSKTALAVARKNARMHNADIHFLHGNLWEPFTDYELQKPCDIVANLPYIPDDMIMGELLHEPRQALAGGPDGLLVYGNLFEQMNKNNQTGCHIYCEILPDQAESLKKLAQSIFTTCDFQTIYDLNSKPRYIQIHI